MPPAQNPPFFPFERQLIAPDLVRGEMVDEVDVDCGAAVEEVRDGGVNLGVAVYDLSPFILDWVTVVPYKVIVPLA
jgi:hypothetical protein